MKSSLRQFFAVAMAMLLVLCAVPAQAQAIVSSTSAVNLSYVVGESVSVSNVPGSLTFSGSPLPQTGNLTVTTSWTLLGTRTHVDTNLYFASPTAAMTDGAGHNISAANVLANVNGGAFSDCGRNPATDTAGVAVTGATCNNGVGVLITSANLTGTRNDIFILELSAAGLSGLPAGTYTGQLNVVAGAN